MQKYVTLEKSMWDEGNYEVLVSGNNSQWTVVYSGSYENASIIREAFLKVGSENVGSRAGGSTNR